MNYDSKKKWTTDKLSALLRDGTSDDYARAFAKLHSEMREPGVSFLQLFKLECFRIKMRLGAAALNRRRIARPPGSTLASLAEFIFSKKTNKDIVHPIISDLQVEYYEALAAHREMKARWVCLRGYWSLYRALSLYTLVRLVVEMWRKIKVV